MTNEKFYVSATDTFLSGWGMATNKTSKIVFECESLEEIETVKSNLEDRTDMIRVSISKSKPKYNELKYQVSYKTKLDAPNFYKKGYFRDQE